MSFSCVIARTSEELRDAQRVRYQVYCDEEGLLPASAYPEGRESDGTDDRADAVHFVVYAGEAPVGTVRLVPAWVAAAPGGGRCFGLELESKYDLATFSSPEIVPAEVTRFCVLRRYRGTRVTAALLEGLRRESARQGLTHWVAGANMATDFVEDAALAHRVLAARNLVGRDFQAVPRSHLLTPTPRQRPFYTAAERQAAAGGDVAGLRLPGPLALFATKMGARYIGPPVYDSLFGVFALPLVTRLTMPVVGATATASPRRPPPSQPPALRRPARAAL